MISSAHGSGITAIALFAKVQVRLPVPCALYCAVKVVLPGVSPLTTAAADARVSSEPETSKAFESDATSPPLDANDIRQFVPLALPINAAVTVTSTLPEAGTVTVADGPGVVRLP